MNQLSQVDASRLEVVIPTQPAATVQVDLDGAAHIFRAHGWPYEGDADPLFESGLSNALDFFDRFHVRATLFVIAEDLRNTRKCELIREAVARGHKIASHSLTHRKLTTLSSDEKRREILESRERLSTELGVNVLGFRAPRFDIDRESLELLNAAGYAYDSSLFPGKRSLQKHLGCSIAATPQRLFPTHSLVELPLPQFSPLPLPFHPSYSLVLGNWYFRAGLHRFRQSGAPLVLLFHLTDFADPLPNHYLQSWAAKFWTVSFMNRDDKLQRCERILKMITRDYQVLDALELLTTRDAREDAQVARLEHAR